MTHQLADVAKLVIEEVVGKFKSRSVFTVASGPRSWRPACSHEHCEVWVEKHVTYQCRRLKLSVEGGSEVLVKSNVHGLEGGNSIEKHVPKYDVCTYGAMMMVVDGGIARSKPDCEGLVFSNISRTNQISHRTLTETTSVQCASKNVGTASRRQSSVSVWSVTRCVLSRASHGSISSPISGSAELMNDGDHRSI